MSSPTQTVAQPGSAPVFAYLVNARQTAFRADGGPSWHTIVDIGQRNSSEKANLMIHLAANALFLAGGGEVDRVATIIHRSSRPKCNKDENTVTSLLPMTPFPGPLNATPEKHGA